MTDTPRQPEPVDPDTTGEPDDDVREALAEDDDLEAESEGGEAS